MEESSFPYFDKVPSGCPCHPVPFPAPPTIPTRPTLVRALVLSNQPHFVDDVSPCLNPFCWESTKGEPQRLLLHRPIFAVFHNSAHVSEACPRSAQRRLEGAPFVQLLQLPSLSSHCYTLIVSPCPPSPSHGGAPFRLSPLLIVLISDSNSVFSVF